MAVSQASTSETWDCSLQVHCLPLDAYGGCFRIWMRSESAAVILCQLSYRESDCREGKC